MNGGLILGLTVISMSVCVSDFFRLCAICIGWENFLDCVPFA